MCACTCFTFALVRKQLAPTPPDSLLLAVPLGVGSSLSHGDRSVHWSPSTRRTQSPPSLPAVGSGPPVTRGPATLPSCPQARLLVGTCPNRLAWWVGRTLCKPSPLETEFGPVPGLEDRVLLPAGASMRGRQKEWGGPATGRLAESVCTPP